jgi:hypothetical protein
MARPPLDQSAQFLAGVVDALNGKHGQLDTRLDKVSLAMPGSPLAVGLNGSVSVMLHLGT